MLDIRAKMLNRRASGEGFMTDDVIRSLEGLGLGPGQTVADIGSGGGYYTLRFARAVGGSGKVCAVDVDRKLLDYIRRQSAAQGLTNVVTVLADGFPSAVPQGSLGLVFVRNVYHHLDDPASYFAGLRKLLGPRGRVVIIDYLENAGGLSFHSLFRHSVSAEKVQDDMAKAGYELERSFAFLPEQFFLAFRPSAPVT
jgi:SAM-dependent methyltransferase